jgi:hypothetical protein
LLLTSDILHGRVRVHLGNDLHQAMPYGYLVAAGTPLEAVHRSLDATAAFLSSRESMPTGYANARPSHSAVVHMRALQAYDGICAGASHRRVASALFGEDVVAVKWDPDGELRAHVRYLIRRARCLVNLGYITLMTARSPREGDIASSVDAP